MLAPVFGGRAPDTTEENLQARTRGAMLMALSNKFGAILLSTGNKSELAVGYCTLYGDMCGGLAVISDVPKTLVYRLARLHQPRPRDHSGRVDHQAARAPSCGRTSAIPTACRPTMCSIRSSQAYVEDALDLEAIVARGHDRAVVAEVIRRIDASEYKRRQAAPGLRISSKAFGVGRRYPIAAGYRIPDTLAAAAGRLRR